MNFLLSMRIYTIVTSSVKQAALTKQWVTPTTTTATGTWLQAMKEKIGNIAYHDNIYHFLSRFGTFIDTFYFDYR